MCLTLIFNQILTYTLRKSLIDAIMQTVPILKIQYFRRLGSDSQAYFITNKQDETIRELTFSLKFGSSSINFLSKLEYGNERLREGQTPLLLDKISAVGCVLVVGTVGGAIGGGIYYRSVSIQSIKENIRKVNHLLVAAVYYDEH